MSLNNKKYLTPRFHLFPQSGWLNDPNGLCQLDGIHHIFFQYSPDEPKGGEKTWGHYSTKDFINYEFTGVFMKPDMPEDASGVYSGCAYVEDGQMYIYYTGNVKHPGDYDYILEGRESNTILVTSQDGIKASEKKILLRSAKPEEAQLLVDYLKTVCGETRFLLCDPDEVKYTAESEVEFINAKNSSEDSMLMLAFVDGEYAGNCSFQPIGSRRRARHRVDIGIALYQKYTGFGLGRLMLEQLLFTIKELGYEQAELTVVGGNDRAYHLYESLGFKECGYLRQTSIRTVLMQMIFIWLRNCNNLGISSYPGK